MSGPNKKPKENIDLNTVLANFALFLDEDALIDSLADAYNWGIAGANNP